MGVFDDLENLEQGHRKRQTGQFFTWLHGSIRPRYLQARFPEQVIAQSAFKSW